MNAAQEDGLWRAIGGVEGDLSAVENECAMLRLEMRDAERAVSWLKAAVWILIAWLAWNSVADLRWSISSQVMDATCVSISPVDNI